MEFLHFFAEFADDKGTNMIYYEWV